MRIKEFSIDRYGPLHLEEKVEVQPFHLFFGGNEAGKTLMIEALLRMMFQDVRGTDFPGIHRVDVNPQGYILFHDPKYGEIQCPHPQGFHSFFSMTPRECRNIMVIRDGDLSLCEETVFYSHVTRRLTGLRTGEIEDIQETLKAIGNLTQSGKQFKNDEGSGKLKERLDRVDTLLKSGEELLERIEENSLHELERQLAQNREEKTRLEKELERLNRARKADLYKKGSKALKDLTIASRTCSALKGFSQEERQLYRDTLRDLDQNCLKQKRIHKTKQELQDRLKEVQKERQTAQSRSAEYEEERENLIRAEILLKDCEEQEEMLAQARVGEPLLIWGCVGTAFLLGLTLLGSMLFPSYFYYGLSALFLVILLPLISGLFIRFRNKGRLEQCKKTLWNTLSSPEEMVCYHEIKHYVQRQKKQLKDALSDLKRWQQEENTLIDRLKNLEEEEIPRLQREEERCHTIIMDIQRNSGQTSFEGYDQKVKALEEGQALYAKSLEILEGLLSSPSHSSRDQTMDIWRQRLEEYAFYVREEGLSFDQKREDDCQQQHRVLENTIEKRETLLRSLQEELHRLGEEANAILPEEDRLPCCTCLDLPPVLEALKAFRDHHQEIKELITEAVKIFSELKAEEEKKVETLFAPEGRAGRFFASCTGGMYETLVYHQEKQVLEVQRRDGTWLQPWQLSGGTYDQLYLSVRLALGEEVLAGDKGFFLLDDPFIKADCTRLKEQLHVVHTIVQSGWQVLLFTARKEVQKSLMAHISAGTVGYRELADLLDIEG